MVVSRFLVRKIGCAVDDWAYGRYVDRVLNTNKISERLQQHAQVSGGHNGIWQPYGLGLWFMKEPFIDKVRFRRHMADRPSPKRQYWRKTRKYFEDCGDFDLETLLGED